MRNITFSLESLFEEIKERAFDEGAFDRISWNEVVEFVIQEKQSAQEVDDDFNWVGVTEAMKSKFEEFQEEVPVM